MAGAGLKGQGSGCEAHLPSPGNSCSIAFPVMCLCPVPLQLPNTAVSHCYFRQLHSFGLAAICRFIKESDHFYISESHVGVH